MAAVIGLALASAWRAGTWVVLLPVLGAVVALTGAALAVDYFGLGRRRAVWPSARPDPRAAWRRSRALWRRFRALKRSGSPRTAPVARALLLALAECDRLREAGEVVDFLAADAAFTRVGADPVADAVRAIALAELGRVDEARPVAGRLLAAPRCARRPIAVYAWARVAEVDGRVDAALRAVDESLLARAGSALRRDLLLLRARCELRRGRGDAAADVLRRLARERGRRAVEEVADASAARGDAALAVAARAALSAAAPYR
ncbi:MAG: hypothetical protein D6689_06040 [Deltaproteobacteria bacterium]|nr:MAG: hypothetical protein D6689_06040 [Deltaproteobacteria bacterium]